MDNVIKNVYSQDLSGIDVQTLTKGKAVIRLYKDLLNFDNIFDFIGKTNCCILLFPVANDYDGHWTAILYHPERKQIEHFDSYGFSWKQEIPYTTNKFVQKNLLGTLYQKAMNTGYSVVYNPYRLQKMVNANNTCGRWSCVRIRFSYLSSEEFAKLFLNQTMPPDFLVSILTFLSIKEDETDEQAIIRMFSGMKKK